MRKEKEKSEGHTLNYIMDALDDEGINNAGKIEIDTGGKKSRKVRYKEVEQKMVVFC